MNTLKQILSGLLTMIVVVAAIVAMFYAMTAKAEERAIQIPNTVVCHTEDAARQAVGMFLHGGFKAFQNTLNKLGRSKLCSEFSGSVVIVGKYPPVQNDGKKIYTHKGRTPANKDIWLFKLEIVPGMRHKVLPYQKRGREWSA